MAHSRCPRTGRFNRFNLSDDGTMDTVVTCSQCGAEFRGSYDPGLVWSDENPSEAEQEKAYDAWVEELCAEAAEDHEAYDAE